MGAWIEIKGLVGYFAVSRSHPTWVRGLKSIECEYNMLEEVVAPHMGAWIEISIWNGIKTNIAVAPHMGAWIEIYGNERQAMRFGRTPHGCVD